MVTLSTARLELREAKRSDVEALAAYQADPRYLEHYETPPDPGKIVAQDYAEPLRTHKMVVP